MVLLEVTHIRAEPSLLDGFTQLFFYIKKKGVIFLGTNNNPITQENLDRGISEKKILKLKNPLFIEEGAMLLLDYDSKVYTSKPLKEEMKLQGKLTDLIEQ